MKKIVLSLLFGISFSHALNEKSIAQAWQEKKYSHSVVTVYTHLSETHEKNQLQNLMFDNQSRLCFMERRCEKNSNVFVPVFMQCSGKNFFEIEVISFNKRIAHQAWDIHFKNDKQISIYNTAHRTENQINFGKEFGVKLAHDGCLVAVNNHFCVMGVKKNVENGVSKHLYLFEIGSSLNKTTELTFLTDLGVFNNADCADINDDGTMVVMAEKDGSLHYFGLKDKLK